MILRNMDLMGSRVNFYLFKKLVIEIPWEAPLGPEELTRGFRTLFLALHPRESGIKH